MTTLPEALKAVGVTESAFARNPLGHLYRQGRFVEGRRKVFEYLRGRGMSYPTIAATCGMKSHSAVLEALRVKA